MSEIIARRQFDPLYIWLDIAFLIFFAILLLIKKRYMTVIVGAVFGIVYMIVDYGIFHLLCGSREIFNGDSLFWVLLWMSISYGFTNFAWIWLFLSKDRYLLEWSTLIIAWWICCPLITQTFGHSTLPVIIQRTTGAYHGYMAVILFIGYAGLIVWNVFQKQKENRFHIPWILFIGIFVQFCWETALLLGGIRSAGFESFTDKLLTLAVNSLLETNLGMPYIYLIFLAVTCKFTEQLTRRTHPFSFLERLQENNLQKLSKK